MTQAQLLQNIATTVSTITGKTYQSTYAPIRNLSEQTTLYRYVQANGWRRERLTRGCPEVKANIVIGIIGLAGNDEQVAKVQDELDFVLYQLLKSQPTNYIVMAGETIPVAEQPISPDGLSADEAPIINAKINISVRFQSTPTMPQ